MRLWLAGDDMRSDRLRRREFLGVLGGAAAAWRLEARAQDAGTVRRVGVLSSIGESDLEAQAMAAAFQQALRKAGWVDGRNLRIDHRWAAGIPGRVEVFAQQLIALQPDVVVAHTTPSVMALRKETDTIPIVFLQVSDPIGSGFITNLAHPGGNITGFTNFEAAMVGKWVEMLKEMAPSVARMTILVNPETAPYVSRYYQDPFQTAARSLGVEPSGSPVHSAREIESDADAHG
jgi:putative ABC transport system substrate-binding protein